MNSHRRKSPQSLSGSSLRLSCFVLFAAFLFVPAAFGQVAPVVTSLNPSTATAGGPGFTLIVNGANFTATSVVRVNGANRATTLLSATQLQAPILGTDIAAPTSLAVTVFTPVVGIPAGGLTSNTAFLTVTAIAPPALTSATPGLTSPGALQIRMTLTGSNFRPGARVIISPPLPSVSGSTGTVQATDISVDDAAVLGSGLIVAVVSISPAASAGLRAVDVLNTDGTNTGVSPLGAPGTSKPLRIAGSSSLGAPLNVTTIAITNPRDGAVINQGEEFYGTAALAGTGSGLVVGAWYWDGNITEQFIANFAGGQSVSLRSQHSFPTALIGVHTVELRILSPNRVSTRPVTVVVNRGDFSVENLLEPAYGTRTSPQEPPLFRWAPVPGIDKYEIGFSTQPYFLSIKNWHEVNTNEWQATPDVWDRLPDGELYWTVRAVELSGTKRKPLPMRLLLRFPAKALRSTSEKVAWTPQGNPLLEWNGLEGWNLYRITISDDPEGTHIVRRYLARTTKIDLRALKGKLDPTKSYSWYVEALDSEGHTVLTGPVQTLTWPSSPSSKRTSPNVPRFVLASYVTPVRQPTEALGQPEPPTEIKTLANRVPAPGGTVSDPKAPVKLDFSAAPNVFDLAIQVDGTDVTSVVEATESNVTYTPPVPFTDGVHEIIVTLGADSSAWKFTVKAQAPKPPKASDAEQATKTEAKQGPWQSQTQVAVNTQWVSGSARDTNAVSVAEQLDYQSGPWKAQINGSGLLNSVLGPESLQSSLGRFNSYVFQTALQSRAWGITVRFGILAPSLYQNAQFVTSGAARQAIETTLKTPAGSFGFFANTDDQALGGGSGFAFHQQLFGASWQLPLPTKYLELRLMWLSANDTGNALTTQTNLLGQTGVSNFAIGTPGGGDLYGALLLVHLAPKWLWSSEYSWGYNDSDTVTGLSHLFGRAWRSGVNGAAGPVTTSFSYINVGPNFASPANPGLTLNSVPDRRGPSFSLSVATPAGTFAVGNTYLQSNFDQVNFPRQGMNAATESWSKNLGKITTLAISAHETSTTTEDIPAAVQALSSDERLALEADQRDAGFNVSVTRQVGKTLSMNLMGSRDWFRNNLITGANTITSSVGGGVNWAPLPFFQLNTNISANWIAGEKSTVGGTRSLSGYVQPTFSWKRTGLQVQPILSVNQSQTVLNSNVLINNMLTQQYGGRVGWTMPGRLKFSILSMEGDYTDSKNPVFGFRQQGTTLYLLWTIVWGHKQVF